MSRPTLTYRTAADVDDWTEVDLASPGALDSLGDYLDDVDLAILGALLDVTIEAVDREQAARRRARIEEARDG